MNKKIFLILIVSFFSSLVFSEDGPIQLESTFVGDKEQPSVSYFIPWNDTGTPDNLYRNIEGSYDQSLDTVDRDVLLRSMRMYEEMNLEKGELFGKDK